MTTLVVGCGYLGTRVARTLIEQGDRVFGTSRTREGAARLQELGVEPVVADVLEPDSLAALPAADRVFYAVGFDRGSGRTLREVYVDGLRHALGRIVERAGRIVYSSSTGVYGRDDGGAVDENSPTDARHESGRVAVEAEATLRAVAGAYGVPAVVLRFAGLYGPGRVIRRAALERGEPIAGDPERWLNLIHVDDAAAAAVSALERGEAGRVYNAVDNRPVRRGEYCRLAAEYLGAPPPRFVPAESTPREEADRRVSNRRMRDELRVALRFPDITTGLPDAVGSGRGIEGART